ncbi:MAG TPA: PepSY-associated TM helix domain-containing protein, partial [Bacteroidales bacterium]|nr:PepSY-associated TM helix domain-containing protein [Bacteroidales bacterium]
PNRNTLKIFIKGGSVTVDLNSGQAHVEQLRRIPLIYHFNVLHYNNFKKWWTWFSDAYAAGLVVLAISGLFILKGKNGITRRGAWLTVAGILVPIAFFLLYA